MKSAATVSPILMIYLLVYFPMFARCQSYELNSGWKCRQASEVSLSGNELSVHSADLNNWLPAVVPGTVLTTLLHNKLVPDPFFGMNNEKIPDIYVTGRARYTYWFVKDFNETKSAGREVWLTFRGINYSCDVFLNGRKLNSSGHKGMYLRKTYNISSLLSKDGNNRLAVIVYPPDPVGNPNGGQGGDGTIAKNVSHQYVAGWDWIQPVRDRNTGIWDKVFIENTASVNIKNTHIVTLVPGLRKPEGPQQPAVLKVSAELENLTGNAITGIVQYVLEGSIVSKTVTVLPKSTLVVNLPAHKVLNPRLWWPHMYGKQDLYTINIDFRYGGKVSDTEKMSFGIREIRTPWNAHTQSRQIEVNGQKIFIKGGNWIISDAMLRFSRERYDAEIRYHRDMNLNLIRIWGGALIERPEFYEACDRYGLLVMQDFWMSGDCNGRWLDPMKLEDQWTRRKYPDDHRLFLESAADMIKMVRNHPSLALWCGGNEITPPEDILVPLRDSILPALDGTRYFFEYSNSDSMSYNFIGGNGDGPYTIQPVNKFWEHRTFPFNSEIGSVGIGDYESLERFIPAENMKVPEFIPAKIPEGRPVENVDPVWDYHKYKGVGYEQYIEPYGKPADVRDFAKKAQLVNYEQYRGMAEGFSSHIWDWYSGFIIWKTQNPWTAMRGQMYDYYLDPNACLYGLRSGSEPAHIMYNPIDGMISGVNNSFEAKRNLMLVVKSYDMEGKDSLLTQVFVGMEPSSAKKYLSVKPVLDRLAAERGIFLSLQLLNEDKTVLSENFYWIPDAKAAYSGLARIKTVSPVIRARTLVPGKTEVSISNAEGNAVAFFNRLSVIDMSSGKRILPAFYSDNYISVTPGDTKKIIIEFTPVKGVSTGLSAEGWNVDRTVVPIIQ